jgi:hypothetical protein
MVDWSVGAFYFNIENLVLWVRSERLGHGAWGIGFREEMVNGERLRTSSQSVYRLPLTKRYDASDPKVPGAVSVGANQE